MSDVEVLRVATDAAERELLQCTLSGRDRAAAVAGTVLAAAGMTTSLDQPSPLPTVDPSESAHDHLISFIRGTPLLGGQQSWVAPLCRLITERRDFGLRKYGVVLHPNNGRDTFDDWIAELLDALAYAQVALEQAASKKSIAFVEARRLRLITMVLDLMEEKDRADRPRREMKPS